MANKQGPFIPVPQGDVCVHNPDGVTRNVDGTFKNSLTDAYYVGDGYGYGAFNNGGLWAPGAGKGDAAVTTAKKRD